MTAIEVRARKVNLYAGGRPWYFYPGDGTDDGADLLVSSDCPDAVVEQTIATSMYAEGIFPAGDLGRGSYSDVLRIGSFAFKRPGGSEGDPVQAYGFGADSLAVNDAVAHSLRDIGVTWGGCDISGVALYAAWLPHTPKFDHAPVWAMDYVEGDSGWKLGQAGDDKEWYRDYAALERILYMAVGQTGLGAAYYSKLSLDVVSRNIIYGSKGTATKIDSMAADGTYQDVTTYLQRLERT